MCLPLKPFKIEREWMHAGLKCTVVQAREAANRCGYVRVPPTHPLYGKGYEDVDVLVHGGLTFADIEPCTEEDGRGWWFGFDCAHWGDAMYDPNPDFSTLSKDTTEILEAMSDIRRKVSLQFHGEVIERWEHFWTQAEVERECEQLAEQLAQAPRPIFTSADMA